MLELNRQDCSSKQTTFNALDNKMEIQNSVKKKATMQASSFAYNVNYFKF